MLKYTAKVFTGRDSQIVHLPAGVHLTGSEVLMQQDPDTGAVTLSEKPQTWDAFFAARDAAVAAGEIPDDFIDLEERKRIVHDRDPFAGMDE